MSDKNRNKPRKRRGVTALILSLALMIAGSAAVVIPIVEDNRTLSREEAEYEQLAEELKDDDLQPAALPEDETPVTPEGSENDDELEHTQIHPPDLPVVSETSPPNAPDEQEASESSLQPTSVIPSQQTPSDPSPYGSREPTVPSHTAATHTPAAETQVKPPPSTGTEEVKPTETSAPTATPRPGNTGANLQACLAKNSEFVAWLKIPGTKVDYPVVLTDNVSFYLDHSFTGSQSKLGTLFSLGKTDYRTPGRNIAIYGHHITNTSSGQKMFRPLLSYKQKSFWERHQTIFLDSLYHIGVYRVFAVIDMVDGDWDPSMAAFPGENSFLRFVRNAQACALYDTGVEVRAGDHILTLITCDRDFAAKEGRLVVMAVEQ